MRLHRQSGTQPGARRAAAPLDQLERRVANSPTAFSPAGLRPVQAEHRLSRSISSTACERLRLAIKMNQRHRRQRAIAIPARQRPRAGLGGGACTARRGRRAGNHDRPEASAIGHGCSSMRCKRLAGLLPGKPTDSRRDLIRRTTRPPRRGTPRPRRSENGTASGAPMPPRAISITNRPPGVDRRRDQMLPVRGPAHVGDLTATMSPLSGANAIVAREPDLTAPRQVPGPPKLLGEHATVVRGLGQHLGGRWRGI